MFWRPIETAPKDGTRIMVAFRKRVDVIRADDLIHKPAWLLETEYPTHWMPLPLHPNQLGYGDDIER